jgi:hypothetical protein
MAHIKLQEGIYRQMADRVVRLGYTQPGWEKPFPTDH